MLFVGAQLSMGFESTWLFCWLMQTTILRVVPSDIVTVLIMREVHTCNGMASIIYRRQSQAQEDVAILYVRNFSRSCIQ